MHGRLVMILIAVGSLLAASIAGWLLAHDGHQRRITIGAKNFTESRILMEVMAQAIERATGAQVARQELGSTALCYAALRSGELSAYGEYTGTLARELLALGDQADDDAEAIAKATAAIGLTALPALGLNDTYVLAIREERAQSLGIASLSDLARHPELSCGFTSEFIQRQDGLPALTKAYGMRFEKAPVDLSPSHQYAAAHDGMVDVISAFSTDARLKRFGLRALQDDRGVFPAYRALPLAHAGFAASEPTAIVALRALAGTIDDETMRSLNARVDIDGASPRQVASEFLDHLRSAAASPGTR
jgi:osmoprotectant transport system permease protein